MFKLFKLFSSRKHKVSIRDQFPLSQVGKFRESNQKLSFYNKDFKKLVQTYLEPNLKSIDFEGENYIYYREFETHTFFILLGLSKYGGAISIDIGVKFKPPYSKEIANIKEINPFRFESRKRLSPDQNDNWWAFKENEADNKKIIQEMWKLIQLVAIPYFNSFKSLDQFFAEINILEFLTDKYYEKYNFFGRKIFGYYSLMQYYLRNNIKDKALKIAKAGFEECSFAEDEKYKKEFEDTIKNNS